MISNDRLEAYRAMSFDERWREVESLMTLAWQLLKALPPEEIDRRLAQDRRQHDLSDEIMLDFLRRRP